MILTKEILESGLRKYACWTRFQLQVLGIPADGPLQHDWQKTLIGKDFPEDVIKSFVHLGSSDPPIEKEAMSDLKIEVTEYRATLLLWALADYISGGDVSAEGAKEAKALARELVYLHPVLIENKKWALIKHFGFTPDALVELKKGAHYRQMKKEYEEAGVTAEDVNPAPEPVLPLITDWSFLSEIQQKEKSLYAITRIHKLPLDAPISYFGHVLESISAWHRNRPGHHAEDWV
jgi:hypothetical protein